jgi:hypothetical protein
MTNDLKKIKVKDIPESALASFLKGGKKKFA